MSAAVHGRRALPALRANVERLERNANRETRRAAWAAVRCERGRGFLVNRKTGASYPAPCRSWRDCNPCARAYGMALSRRWSKVSGLRASLTLTMPPGVRERWREKEAIAEMMRSWRKFRERTRRSLIKGELKCSAPCAAIPTSDAPALDASAASTKPFCGPKILHFKEHAGNGPRAGLHLNVLWNIEWLDQGELAERAAACGFGAVSWIHRIGGSRGVDLAQGRPGSSAAVSYSMKQGFRVVAYARKTGGKTGAQGDDWPKRVRRWSASRAASREMGPRPHNPEWAWAAVEPRPAEAPATLAIALDADRKCEPRLYPYDAWLARQRRAWSPRGPDGEMLSRGSDGKFRIATE
jgi:hypothetical protein